MKGRKRRSRSGKKLNLMDAEDLTIYEVEVKTEDLRCDEAEKDMISEGETIDDSSIISRVKLF